MIKLSVKVGRAAEVARKLGNFRGNKVMADEFEAHKARVLAKHQASPPERPGQRYRRTGRLRAGWKVEAKLTGNGATLTASNTTDYAKWVQDKPNQAWMHQGRWDTSQDIMASEEEAIKTGIVRRATEVLK